MRPSRLCALRLLLLGGTLALKVQPPEEEDGQDRLGQARVKPIG